MKNSIFALFILIIIALGGWELYRMHNEAALARITDFDTCAAQYPVMESYPEQCATPDGRHFVRNIGNAVAKRDLIYANNPAPNAVVSGDVHIVGEARGTWFFEASFPIELTDASGKIIAQTHAKAKSDWMTTEFVPFDATITVPSGTTGKGTLVLKKDNPSGLPEKDDELDVPVEF